MPGAGFSAFGGTFDPDSGMPSSTAFGGEFILDAEDTFNASSADFFGVDTGDSDALQALEPSAFADSKALLTTSGHPQHSTKPGAPGFSPPSHRDSSSSASSRSNGSNSPKTSNTSGDVTMTDEAAFGDWKGVDGLPSGDAPNYELFDESMDSAMDPSSHFSNNYFDFDSASNSPSPPTADGQTALSSDNHVSTATIPTKSPNAKRAKGHGKAQSQHSLTHSMQTLRTNGSREVSPMFASHESSPAALFNQTPPPDGNVQFFNGGPSSGYGGNQVWPGHFRPAMGSFQAQPPVGNMPAPSHGLPSYASQLPVFPNAPPRLVFQPTPAKSRVETQIPIKMTVYNMPSMYKRLHLPLHTISKAKLLAKQGADRSPDMLELYTMLVCSSAMQDEEKRKKAFARAAQTGHPSSPEVAAMDNEDKAQNGGEVRICQGCITRERKRAGRKKNKKPEEDELWDRFQNHRAIVFNTNEVKEWQVVADQTPVGIRMPPGTMQVDAPMRIACYCRHHGEKTGFNVIFTIKDFQDRVIVQEMSSTIMITDDHKTHLPANPPMQSSTANSSDTALVPVATEAATDGNSLETPMPFRHPQSTSDLQSLEHNTSPSFQQPISGPGSSQGTSVTATPRNQSRQASPSSPSGPVSKKRKASGPAKLPTGLAMTRLDTSHPSVVIPPPIINQSESTAVSAATSPFSPSLANFPISSNGNSFYAQGPQPGLSSMQQPFTTGPPTPNSNSNDQIFTGANRNMSMDNLAQPLFSAPVSAHPSRAPSPNHLRNEVNALQSNQLAQALYQPMNMGVPRPPSPMIHKIIPGEGPKSGGIEVTILGSGFTNGGLEVMFGEQRATTTTFWGESSLVCLLPPSPITGPVIVTIKQPRMPEQAAFVKNPPIFRYVDDNEEQLMRTALAVLGQKIGGNISDVADIARSILNTRGGGQQGWGPAAGSGGQAPGGYNFEHAHSLESGLLRVLELIDLDDSVNKARINLRRSTGQTMLHLGCALGMIRFVAGLLSRGANVGARDKGGFTPLHFAAMTNQPEIVRRLMISGADPTMRSLSGLTPADVARSRDVLRVLRQVESHSRSRSGGSLHSRVSSATSLRSLWDPPSMTSYRQDFLSDASDQAEPSDSYEDSSDDDDEVANGEWLDMRRPSILRTPHQLSDIASPPVTDVPAGMASPTAAMTAFREQFAAQVQQLQQSMALHLQSWPQFQMPQMPQMPHMPVLPDYHNYLHNAPVMQRIASLVPNIGGSRPGSAGEQTPRDGDKQWWEVPSFFSGKEAAPPAYEDIFPQKDLDIKQATAAAAAAEYEADMKCATLYDQDQAVAESSKAREVPTLLQIGRKNAITKEQQEYLQRAHAARLKTGSSDKMLWFVWIPLLALILGAMLFNGAPAFAYGVAHFVRTLVNSMAAPKQTLQRVGAVAGLVV